MKGDLTTSLQELSKASAQSAKLLVSAEGVLAKVNSLGDGEIIEMNLTKLRQVSEEAEEVS